MDLFMWLFAGSVAGFSIFIVWLILYFIKPMKDSPARFFVKAKREGKPVVFLDTGKFFRCIVGDDKVGHEKHQIIRSKDAGDVVKFSNFGGIKYCHGVVMGIAEDFRSMIANISIVELMELIDKKGWTEQQIKEKLDKLSDTLKKDLGITDELDILDKEYTEEVKDVEKGYEKEKAMIIKNSEVPDDPEETQAN